MDKGHYVGTNVGNYTLKLLLGVGTYGEVYLAEHRYDRRPVAIKLMTNLPQSHTGFLEEARNLLVLRHEYILTIIDFDPGGRYIIMEYARNGTLAERLKQYSPQRLSLSKAIEIITQIGKALQYAHSNNIVHRDLKPANILFNENDDALLADFGISLALEFGATTRVEYIQGTFQYMAPEQFIGEVSVKSDQYALGCIAYELVTGEKAIKADIPFNASPDMQRDIWKHCHENQTPEPPRSRLNTDLPSYAETAILRALEKNRVNRYSNVNDFIKALGGTSTLTDVDLVKGSSLWLKEGNEQFKNKRFDEALKAFDNAIALYPDEAKFYINKGNVLRELHRYIEALDAYRGALEVASQSNKDICYVNMGHVLCDLKSFDEALKMYDMAIKTSPDKAIFYVHKARVLQEKNLYSASLSVYEHAILNAENEFVAAKAYTGKGNALLKLKNYPEAFEAYREALKRNPRDVSIYLTQGHALWKSSFYQAALDVYERGLKIDPENTELLERRNALKRRGR